MSTIKVNKIENTATADGGIAIDATGHVQIDGVQLPNDGQLSNRNLVINGAMQVAQRGTSVTSVGTAVAYNTVDRWRFADSSDPTARFTETQSTDAPAGFSNSRKFEVTTADSAVEADEQQYTDHFIEAQNAQHLAFGTASAKKITLSFYVKASVAQTYGLGLQLHDGGGSYYGVSYTVNSANTWEYKTITFNGNTSVSIDNDNGRGIRIKFGLNVGSNFVDGTDATNWEASGSEYGTHSNTWVGTVGNTWQITGVQLEVGSKATTFEHRSFGDELARCQRYFAKSYEYGTAKGTVTNNGAVVSTAFTAISYAHAGVAFFPVSMRAAPSVTIYGTTGTINSVNADSTDGTGAVSFIGNNSCAIYRSNDSSGVGANVFVRAHYLADAEL